VSLGEHETVKLCTGRDPTKLPSEGFTEALVLCGRRSGKSKIIGLVGAAEAVLSGKERALSQGEIPMVSILSPTRNQSRIIHSYLRGAFDSTPLLQNEVTEEKRESFMLRNGVEVSIITGDPRSCRGFSLIACIVDEVAMFGLSEESKVRSDLELVRALRPALVSIAGGRLLCVGTPYAARGYTYQTWKSSYANDEGDILVWNAPSLLMNPTLSQRVVDRAMAEDPDSAKAEFGAQCRDDISSYVSRELVESCVIRGRIALPPRFGTRYAAFTDLSGGRVDDAAIAIAHRENDVVVLDLIRRWRPPFDPIRVIGEMVMELKRYNVREVVGDRYAGEFTRGGFERLGVRYVHGVPNRWARYSYQANIVAKSKAELFLELLPRLQSRRIELLDNETLISQLASLERRTRSGGRDVVDHGPNQHDDIANVVAGVANAVPQHATEGRIFLQVY
jgi:hypothetical protein